MASISNCSGRRRQPMPNWLRTLGLTGKDVIGYIGSFYDYEGLDDLIAAMPMMESKAHLLLVGGGPMEEALRAQSEASAGRRPHPFRWPRAA